MAACHRCGTAFDATGIVSRSATCPSCNAFSRSCRNCDHFDERAKNQCREPNAEPVSDKVAATFCELYQPNKRTATSVATTPQPTNTADPFAALFKK
jgi:hypothetical protein